MIRDARQLLSRLALCVVACAALLAPLRDAAAQNSSDRLAFSACWTVCGPSANEQDPDACARCLSGVCAERRDLANHPACVRAGVSSAPSGPVTAPVPRPPAPQPPALVEPEPTPEPTVAAAPSTGAPLCDIAACDAAYRTFRASDCTYQPYEGPRRLCTRGDPVAATAAAASVIPPTPAAAADGFVCNIAACDAAYRTFRASDCTYQPYEGPRRICERGQDQVQIELSAPDPNADSDATATAALEEEIDRAFSAAEEEEAAFPEIDAEALERARAELDAEETFDAVALIAAPAGYGLFALVALLKLLLLRAEPVAAAAAASAGVPSAYLSRATGSSGGFRARGAATWPEDFSRG